MNSCSQPVQLASKFPVIGIGIAIIPQDHPEHLILLSFFKLQEIG